MKALITTTFTVVTGTDMVGTDCWTIGGASIG